MRSIRVNHIIKYASTLLFFFFYTVGFAQTIIQGKVLDEQTKQPVQNASVYFNNTQIGFSTNEKGQFKLYANRVYNDLVVSAIGYEKITIPIIKGNSNYTILLKEKINSLEEINISVGKNDWPKWGDLFSKLLIGNTHDAGYCKILNPKVLRFYYDKDENNLEVTSNNTLLVEHAGLGYTLRIDIDKFKYDFVKDALDYSVSIFYEGKRNKFSRQNESVASRIYLGSKMHFYRSLYNHSLEEENYRIYHYSSVKNTNKERILQLLLKQKAQKMANGEKYVEFSDLLDNKDSLAYYKSILKQDDVLKWDTVRADYKKFLKFDSIKNTLNFKFSDTLMVLYEKDRSGLDNMIKKRVEPEKFKSYFQHKTLLFLTDKEGVNIDPAGFGAPNVLYMIGEMGDRRLAGQLPFDFVYKAIRPINH